jgi:hypothetical protein
MSPALQPVNLATSSSTQFILIEWPSFANMIGADFRGAEMVTFEYGYSTLNGQLDEFTQLSVECALEADFIDCTR